MQKSITETLEERGSKYGPFSGHARATQYIKRSMHDELRQNKFYQNLNATSRCVIDEALDMIAHKIGRIVNGDPTYGDSWRDIAGYATLVERHFTGERDNDA